MPLKLIPPRKGKSPNWSVRGTHIGIFVDRSTKTSNKKLAGDQLKEWKGQIERREYDDPRASVEAKDASPKTFLAAAVAYMNASGERKYIQPILDEWKETPLENIDQVLIDNTAEKLFPGAPATTKNRNFYTPVSAVLKRVGIDKKIKRPKGWRGKKSTSWLDHQPAFSLLEAAYEVEVEFGLLCHTYLYTGTRLSEGLSRALRDLSLERAFLYLDDSKNGDSRGCHLPPHLVEAFLAQPPRIERKIAVRGHRGFFTGTGGGRAVQDAGIPFLKRGPDAKLFRYHKGGALYDLMHEAQKKAGLTFPPRQGGFHLFCHTYGTWLHRYGKLDTFGMLRTGRWKDAESADRYVHTEASEEAKTSNLFPTPNFGNIVELQAKRG